VNQNKIVASRTAIAAAGLGLALALSLTAGAAVAQAATPGSAACTAAKQQVVYAQSSLDEATGTRNTLATQVAAQKADRQNAINAGNVEKVGRINVQLGSSTALYNTMDSSVASAQALVVRTKAARNAAC
jgi:hypothetical protein